MGGEGDRYGGGRRALLGQRLERQRGDEVQRLAALVVHEAHGALIDHPVQRHQAGIAARRVGPAEVGSLPDLQASPFLTLKV